MTNRSEPGPLQRPDLEKILARAAELDGSDESGTYREEDLTRVGLEVGISSGSVQKALDEWRRGHLSSQAGGSMVRMFGPDRVVVERISGRDAGRLDTLATRYLTDRGLIRRIEGGKVTWRQHDGWWPDLQRLSGQTRLEISYQAVGWGVWLRATADVGRLRSNHLWLAVAALLLPALMALGGAGAVAVGWAAPLAAALSWWAAVGFRRRVRGIEERLCAFVEDIAGRDVAAGRA